MVSKESLNEFRCELRVKFIITYDFQLMWRATGCIAGYKDVEGRVSIRIDGKLYLAHRLIYLMFKGELPDLIDHIDRDPTNNNINNLRGADKRINAINTGLPNNNTSGIKGVSWHKAGGKWTAQIKDKGRKIHLGSYSLLEDAIEARVKAEEEFWGDIKRNEGFIARWTSGTR
jgi:hypothetical protein